MTIHGRTAHYVLLLAVGAALTLPNLGGPSLWDIDEAHNAQAAQEMLESGNLITPTFNYQLRVDKPALLYWLQIAAYQIFGVGEFGARLPSALAALVCVLLTYELGRRLFDSATGLLAGLMLPAAGLFCAAAHFANPDALLCACTTLTFALFWASFPRGGRSWLVLPAASMGLAALAKGPVGLLLPAGVIGLYLLWTRQLRRLLDLRLLVGLGLFLLVSLPWCILVGAETKGQFLYQFIGTHNLGRFRAPMENHHGPLWYYLVTLLVGFAPWSIFLGPTIWYAVRGEGEQAAPGPAPLPALGALAGLLLGGLKGYSLGLLRLKGPGGELAASLPGATFWDMLKPIGALMLAGAVGGWLLGRGWLLLWARLQPRRAEGATPPRAEPGPGHFPREADAPRLPARAVSLRPAYSFLWCWIALYVAFFSLSGTKLPNYILPIYPAVAILTARFVDRWRRGEVRPLPWVLPLCLSCLALIGMLTAVGFLVAGGTIELALLRGRKFPELAAWAVLGVVPVLGALLAGWYAHRDNRAGVVSSLTATAVLFVGPLAAGIGATLDAYKSPRALVRLAGANDTGREIRVGCLGFYQPSLVFYCRREVAFFKQAEEGLEFLRCPLPVYLFVPGPLWEKLQGQVQGPCRLLGRHPDLYRGADVVVVTNR